MAKKILAIDLGGTSVKIAIVTPEGKIQDKWTIKTNVLDDGIHIVPEIIESIKERIAQLELPSDELLGIGMGSPGQVDDKEKTVIGAYNLDWVEKQYVGEQLTNALNLPVFLDNDANVAALGERWMGAGSLADDVVFVTLGTGVGGGIIANGELLHGAKNVAGEIGHITVELDHPFDCTCGKKGCLETVASATGIVNLARYHAQLFAGESDLKKAVDDGEEVTAKDVFDLAKIEDKLAVIVAKNVGQYLGLAASHLANILNPSFIVIGGGVSAAGVFLLDITNQTFKDNCFKHVRDSTELRLAQLGNDAGILGAAYLVKVGVENNA